MMTPLRQQMIGAMRQRGFSVRTHESYLTAVRDLARYYRRSPDEITVDKLQGFFDHLARERNLSAASCRLYLNGIRFLYLQVLKWETFDVQLIVPKRPQRIPELLTRQEVRRILAACANPKHRMLLQTVYGCGLRVSEVVALKVRDLGGELGMSAVLHTWGQNLTRHVHLHCLVAGGAWMRRAGGGRPGATTCSRSKRCRATSGAGWCACCAGPRPGTRCIG